MRSAFDDFNERSGWRAWLWRPQRIFILAALAMMLLAGCRLLVDVEPASTPSVTIAPRENLTPTIEILSSEDLYSGDRRAIGETSPVLASLPSGSVLPPAPTGESERGVTVLLDADAFIRGELYQTEGLRRPGALLLSQNVSAWGGLPAKLASNGYVALALQIDSTTQARQIETMLQSLIALPNIDAGIVGVIAEGRAADLALLGCAVNSLCDALALLSPLTRGTLLNMLPSYGARPLWLAAGENDPEALDTVAALAAAARGETRVVHVSAGRGAALLQVQPDLEDELLLWIHSQLGAG